MIVPTEIKEEIKLVVGEKISKNEMFTDKDIANILGYSTEFDVSEVNEEIYRLWSMDFFPSHYDFSNVQVDYSILRDGLAYSDYMVHHPTGKNPNEHPCPYKKKD